jgi:hypothetical protein
MITIIGLLGLLFFIVTVCAVILAAVRLFVFMCKALLRIR